MHLFSITCRSSPGAPSRANSRSVRRSTMTVRETKSFRFSRSWRRRDAMHRSGWTRSCWWASWSSSGYSATWCCATYAVRSEVIDCRSHSCLINRNWSNWGRAESRPETLIRDSMLEIFNQLYSFIVRVSWARLRWQSLKRFYNNYW